MSTKMCKGYLQYIQRAQMIEFRVHRLVMLEMMMEPRVFRCSKIKINIAKNDILCVCESET